MQTFISSEPIVVITQEVGHGQVLARILSEYGYQPFTCDYEQAMDIVAEVRPPLLILGLCGLERARILLQRLLILYPSMQIITLVSEEDYELGYELLAQGAADFLFKPVSDKALRVVLGRAKATLALHNQVESLRAKTKVLEENQQLCRQLFDEVPCYISVQNREQRIVRANRQFKLDFGACLGERCYEVYKHRTHPCPNCPVEQTFADGLVHQTEEVVTTCDGQQKIVLTLTAPIRDEHGEIIEVMELATDITQIRELQGRLTSLGLFISSISHGVRGMLTALDGGLYRLEKGIAKNDLDLVADGAERVKLMVARVRNSVLEMLYYSKERELNIQLIDVRGFAEGVASFVEPKASKYNIQFEKDFHGPMERMEMDSEVISSGLVNILENAIDACLEDESKTQHIVSFIVEGSAQSIHFRIRDNGLGIERSHQEKMFSLFFSSKGSKGTGLGLYIAHEVVKQHGGRIQVDSSPGVGTEFCIELPRKYVPQPVQEEQDKVCV